MIGEFEVPNSKTKNLCISRRSPCSVFRFTVPEDPEFLQETQVGI